MIAPTDSSVEEVFAGLRGKKVFFDSLRGNNGDELIVMGIEELLRRHRVELVDDLGAAEHFLLKGGGALLDAYADLVSEISQLLHETSALPTTWLPTSFGLQSESLSSIIGKRIAPLQIFARERYSFKAMSEMQFEGPVSIGLDHDPAFHLRDSVFLESLRNCERRHVLIVERTDDEALAASPGARIPGLLAGGSKLANRIAIPAGIRTYVRKRLEVPRQRSLALRTEFAARALHAIRSDWPEAGKLPAFALDVSSPRYCSFRQFADIVASAAVVYTTRLHVGILAALLDIPTYLVDGVYHKIRGIFEYSMRDMPHVVLHNGEGGSVRTVAP